MQEVASGFGLIEGPVWDPDKGLYFSDVPNGGVHLLDQVGAPVFPEEGRDMLIVLEMGGGEFHGSSRRVQPPIDSKRGLSGPGGAKFCRKNGFRPLRAGGLSPPEGRRAGR